MQINFDTASIGQNEAQGIILLLTALFPSLNSQPVSTSAPQAPITLQTAIDSTTDAPAPGPTLVQSQSIPAEAPEPATRKRRTKAEIAAATGAADADEAAAKAGDSKVDPAQATATAQATAATSNGAVAVSADELRSLLSSYITRHSMDEAIGKLKAFGCNRVTEAISLEPVKLSALAEELRG